jgi:hypothetical protein
MTDTSAHVTADRQGGPEVSGQEVLLTDDQVRWLRRAVMIMTVALIAGVVLLIGRVIYLARPAATQGAMLGAGSVGQVPLLPEMHIALPVGADIKTLTLSGSRLVVLHSTVDGGDRILVLDLSTGQVLSRVSVGREN